MSTPLRVLLIEDSEDDAELLLHELRRGGYAPTWQRVDTAADLDTALAAGEWDVITCDYVMPQFSAPAALAHIRASGRDLPVIIVSGQIGEEVAVSAMKAGAHDYISKHRMARLLPAIERELAEATSRRARREAEASLRATEEQYRALVETLHDVIFEVDATGTITFISPAITALSGYTPEALVGRTILDFVHPDDLPMVLDSLGRTVQGVEEPAEFRVFDRRGAVHWVRTHSHASRVDGVLVRLRGVLTDITARREAEEAYRAVFEHSLLGLAVAQDGRIVLANQALAALSGWPLEGMIDQPVTGLALAMVHPGDRARMVNAARAFAAGRPSAVPHDFRVVRRDGAVRRVMTTHTDFRYRGAPARMIAYLDVTDRWRAETTYRAVVEHSQQGLVLMRGDRYLMVNPAFAEIFGVSQAELLASTMAEVHARFIHPGDRAEIARLSRQWVEHGEVAAPFEYRVVRPDGTVRVVHCRATRIELDDGPAALIGITDLTELRRAEEVYRAVFEHSPEGLAVFQDDRHSLVNPAHAALLGLSAAEIATLDFEEIIARFVHPEDRARFAAYAEAWAADGRLPDPYEVRLVDTAGQEHLVRCQTTPIAFGERPAVLVALSDLTEQRRAEEAYRGVFEHSLQALLVVSDDRVVMANQACVELTGWGRDELIGLELDALTMQLVHPDDRGQIVETLRIHRAAQTIATERHEFRLLHRQGGVRHVLAQSSAITFGGRPAMLVAHVDLTERWRAEEALRAFNAELEGRVAARTAELERAARELEAFNYSVSHDLRAPLRAIDGYTHAVLDEHGAALPEAARADLQRVRSATGRMAELIDQLLALARVMRGELQRTSVDLSALAREVVDELQSSEPQRRVEVAIAEGLRADGDAALLRALLTNLLDNAWKFTRRRAAPRVEVGAATGNGGAFYVRDNGVGFATHQSAELFQAFRRLHAGGEFDGNGIGLATVARIVTRHGGRVWAQGAEDEGATFYFTLA